MVARPVAGGQAPDPIRIAAPAHRVGDAIGPIGVGCAAAVLEIIEPRAAHHGVADAAEVDEYVAVLVTEQRREGDAPLKPVSAPETPVIRGPLPPQIIGARMSRRSK